MIIVKRIAEGLGLQPAMIMMTRTITNNKATKTMTMLVQSDTDADAKDHATACLLATANVLIMVHTCWE